jgi:DNA-binding response OmpR family regulator
VSRVLIVEDEPHIAEALVFLFEREGFGATVVGDGEAAIAALGAYDLVVLDVMLPGQSGFDVASALRAMDAPPKICVLTAKGQAADRERMAALGVDAFVTKPFSNRALMDTVRALLSEP